MGERRLGNFNSCCRLCLSEKLGTLKSIFEDDSKGQEMARNIKHFLGVQISHNDKLTTMICENCFGQIHDWKLFKKNCDENQTKLVGWMNSWNDSNIGNISIRIKDEIVEDVDDRPIIVEDDDVVHVKTEQQEQESRDEVQANSYGGEPMDEDMYDLPPPLTPHMPGESALHGDDENGQAVDVFSDDEDDDENMSMLVPCIEFSEGREVLMNGNSNDDVNQRECTICGKEFSTPANRKKHERMIHLRKTKKQDYDLREVAERAEESLLAEKSKQRYEKAYNCFKFWCNEKGVQDVGSETVILDYFSEMSESKKAPSLWSIYSMLRTTLARKERVDISKFGKLLTFLKSKNVGYKAKKSTTFTMNNIEIFLKDGPVSFLVHKVALIIGVSGACRSDELYKMKLEDVNFLEKKVCIEVPNTKIHPSRAFMVTNEGWIKIIREYMDLRKNIQNEKFFMQVRLGKMTNQSIGHNTISQFPKKIAAFLNLPKIDTYTGHCYRRTAATLLINNGGDITQLKRLGGRKSLSVVEDYIDSSVSNQVQTARMISKNSNITVAEPSSNSPSFGSTTTQAFQISSKSVAQGASNIQDSDYNRGQTPPTELIELEKIQFAAGLRLQQRSLNQQVTIESATLSEVEVAYLDKCKTIVHMKETLTCACHGESFNEFKDLFVHLKKQRTWFSVFTCYNCLITFGDRSSYMKHYCHCPKTELQYLKRLTEGPVNPEIKIRIYQNFKCTKCDCTFGFHEDFASHFDVQHTELFESDPPFTCICSKSFSDIDDYKQHLHIACFLRHFCDVCFDEFSSVDEFRLHCYKVHDKADGGTVESYDTYNKCKLDSNDEDLPSTSRYSLPSFSVKADPDGDRRQTLDSRHLISASAVRNITKSSEPLNCPLCGKPYSSYHNMLRHYKMAHDKSGKILGCDYCPERFRLISEMREHELSFHAEECASAEDSSKQKDQFNFSCPDCGDLFQTVEEWKEHAETHPTKTCEECGKEFKLQSELDQHRSVHLNIKVYRDSETQDYKSAMSSPSMVCTICNKTFESKIELKKHNLLHRKMPVLSAHDDAEDDKKEVVTKKYSCLECNKHYISYGGIWDHNKKYHGGKSVENDYPKKCHQCDKLLSSKGAWVNHKRWHDRQSPSQSNVPPVAVTTRRTSRHGDEEEESYHTCKRCFKVFSSRYNLRNHMRSHGINLAPNRSSTKTGKVNKTFWCDVCHQACPGYAELQEHKQEHIAKKSKASQQALLNDLQRKETEFPCTYCNLTYTKNFNLLRHIEKHHGEQMDSKPPAIYCKYCKVPFEEVGDLNDHMQTEHEELYNKPKEEKAAVRKFPCKICKKVFDNSAALASHQGWHKRGKFGKKILNQKYHMNNPSTVSEQPNFTCRSCSRKFVNETALQIHILETHRNINTTILSMKCNSCKLTFDSKVKYDNHMQLHEVVESQRHSKAHPCNYCSAGFSRSDTLNAHVRQHHKEFYNDIFRCNECDRVFDKQNALTIHLKVHEKQRTSGEVTIKNANNKSMYFCSICDLGFVIAKDLRNHVVTAHPF